MPGLMDLRTPPPDPSPDPWQPFDPEPEYPSPDATWVLRFSDQWELRMGLPFWKRTQLIHDGRDVSAEQRLASSIGAGAHPVNCYVPWNANSDKVLISTLHSAASDITSGFIIQDVVLGLPTATDDNFWLRGGVWSPHD